GIGYHSPSLPPTYPLPPQATQHIITKRRSSTAEANTRRDMLGLCGSLSPPSLLLPLHPVTPRRLCVRGAITVATRESIQMCACGRCVCCWSFQSAQWLFAPVFLTSVSACARWKRQQQRQYVRHATGVRSTSPTQSAGHETIQKLRHGDRDPQKRATAQRVTAEPNAHTVTTPPDRAWENSAIHNRKANNANRQQPWTRTSDPRPPPPDHSHEQRDTATAPQPAHNARGAGTHPTGHTQRWALIHHDATPKCHCRHTERIISSIQLILLPSPTDASVNDGP
ncbi:hypothetical protein TCSYLVIO_008152, partial [Trypanosoma cruzi]